jgi:hypothetical protein
MRATATTRPQPSHWQAALTMKPYTAETASPIVWQHVFVSDTPMTNWCGGSSLLLSRIIKKRSPTNESHPQVVRDPGGTWRHRPAMRREVRNGPTSAHS